MPRLQPARTRIAAALATAFTAQFAVASPPAPTTLPTGGQVVSGQATIQQAGANMTIQQATHQAILNWQSFSIGSGAAVNFIQPGASSVALNRVLGSDPSAIYGRLTANGQVFLVNPNGVLFGPGARVDVGGLVASTLGIRDADFLARNYRFTREGATGALVNQGELSGQYVALLAPEVRNEGVIAARMGTIALAAGDAVTLGISGQQLVDVQVARASIDTLVENRQLVRAEEGTVILSAQSAHTLLGRVVNSGAIEANGISIDGGVVRLLGSSTVEHSGRIAADGAANGNGGSAILLADLGNPASRTTVSGSISARGGSASGNGGFVETSGSRLAIADSARVDAGATNGASGLWLLDPNDFTIALAGGDITGAALSANLGTNDVTIQSSSGAGGVDGDVFVNSSVTWASNRKLTLMADRSIQVNAEMNVNGAGTLLLNYDVASLGGDIFVRAPINLSATSTFQTQQAANPAVTYTILRNNADLTNVVTGPGANLAGNFVLGANFTATTNPWVPIGNDGAPFTGVFDGLGHRIDGLTRPNTDNAVSGVGLFGRSDGAIRNVGVTNVDVAGAQNVGGLAGINGGTIKNSYSTGSVTGSDKDNGAFQVGSIGGLVGRNNGNIDDSYSSAAVKASAATVPGGHSAGDQGAGGAMNFTQGGIGGLAGSSQSPINNSYATGTVDGVSDVGGLVGYNNASVIGTSYARGKVAGTNNAGGLVGFGFFAPFTPPIFTSTYWNTDAVNGTNQATSANEVGVNESTGLNDADAKLAASYAGFDFANKWVIRPGTSHPLLRSMLPPVFVAPTSGTKVYDGAAYGAIATLAYSTPDTNGRINAGGAVIDGTTNAAAQINAGAYNISLTGVALTAGNDTDQHGFLSLTQLNGSAAITPKPVTLTAPNATKTYDGATTYTATAGELAALSALLGVGADTVTGITLTYTGAAAGAGNKTLTPSAATVSSAAGNYTITYTATNAATITPKSVVLAAPSLTKTFDGTTNFPYASLTPAQQAALTTALGVAGDAVTGVTLTYDTAAVGTNKTMSLSNPVINGGAGTSNYDFSITIANGTSSITAPAVPTPTTTSAPATDAAATVVRLKLNLAAQVPTTTDQQAFQTAFVQDIATATGINPNRVSVLTIDTNRPTNSLAGADTFTNSAGYMVRVPAGSNSSSSTLSSLPESGRYSVKPGERIDVVLPNNTFTHTRPDATVSVEARMADGRPLPGWLRFDSQSGKFQGTPPPGFAGNVNLEVTARDSTGNRATTNLTIIVGRSG